MIVYTPADLRDIEIQETAAFALPGSITVYVFVPQIAVSYVFVETSSTASKKSREATFPS